MIITTGNCGAKTILEETSACVAKNLRVQTRLFGELIASKGGSWERSKHRKYSNENIGYHKNVHSHSGLWTADLKSEVLAQNKPSRNTIA